MKAYLAITGTLFGLIAVLHLLKAIDERRFLSTNPVEYLSMAVLGVVAGALAVWAWRLWPGARR
jgi:H+/Cl- antiporter ClcA